SGWLYGSIGDSIQRARDVDPLLSTSVGEEEVSLERKHGFVCLWEPPRTSLAKVAASRSAPGARDGLQLASPSLQQRSKRVKVPLLANFRRFLSSVGSLFMV